MIRYVLLILFALTTLAACTAVQDAKLPDTSDSPALLAAADSFPDMRWSHVPGSTTWDTAARAALNTHGQALVEVVPADIERWCPAYSGADSDQREAFWVGLLSAMAKHESTYKPTAVSPNGKWFGLLQISPATARGYQCRAGSGTDLKSGSENVSCAIRILSVTVPRDGVIASKDSRWRGVAADWGPMRVGSKQRDISGWLNAQPFCTAS